MAADPASIFPTTKKAMMRKVTAATTEDAGTPSKGSRSSSLHSKTSSTPHRSRSKQESRIVQASTQHGVYD